MFLPIYRLLLLLFFFPTRLEPVTFDEALNESGKYQFFKYYLSNRYNLKQYFLQNSPAVQKIQ